MLTNGPIPESLEWRIRGIAKTNVLKLPSAARPVLYSVDRVADDHGDEVGQLLICFDWLGCVHGVSLGLCRRAAKLYSVSVDKASGLRISLNVWLYS